MDDILKDKIIKFADDVEEPIWHDNYDISSCCSNTVIIRPHLENSDICLDIFLEEASGNIHVNLVVRPINYCCRDRVNIMALPNPFCANILNFLLEKITDKELKDLLVELAEIVYNIIAKWVNSKISIKPTKRAL